MLAKKFLPAVFPANVPVALLLALAALGELSCQQGTGKNRNSEAGSSTLTTTDGYSYKDLNKNGKLDVYEDGRQPVSVRVNDLLGQMSLEEKAGMLFINGARVNDDGSIQDKPARGMCAFAPNALNLVKQKKMNHFNLWAVPAPEALARWYNSMQHYMQDSTRLGIPMTIASDPRNHFSSNIFAMSAHSFSQWCEPLGLGAIGDPALTQQFADVSRRAYLGVGVREAMPPPKEPASE